jgi:hypothetical protein
VTEKRDRKSEAEGDAPATPEDLVGAKDHPTGEGQAHINQEDDPPA